MTLSPCPRRGIRVPLVAGIGQTTKRGFDVIPVPFVLGTTPHEFGDERTSPPRTRSPVDFIDEIVVECDVQTHGPES